MEKFEIYIQCSSCNLRRRKPFLWLKERHLPCPQCGTEFEVNNAHIRIVEMQIQDALKEMDSFEGTRIITLKI